MKPSTPLVTGFLFAAAISLGGLAALGTSSTAVLPQSPATSMTSVHIYWYLGRAGGFVAFGLLFASVALGLAVSSRVFDGLLARPWLFEMHQFLSLLVVIAILFHALILLPDPYAQFKLQELLLPFESHYRAVAVGVGVIVLYGSAIVSGSFWMKGLIGQRGWRALHYLTFLLFVGAILHGLLAGTDSSEPWAKWTYVAAGLAVLFLTFFRILASRRIGREATKASAKHAVRPA